MNKKKPTIKLKKVKPTHKNHPKNHTLGIVTRKNIPDDKKKFKPYLCKLLCCHSWWVYIIINQSSS
jgi:hypothetical protein